MSRTVQGGAACLFLLSLLSFMSVKMFGCRLDWNQFGSRVFSPSQIPNPACL